MEKIRVEPNMDSEEFKEKIGNLFTADGLELVVSYFESLKSKMEKSEINSDQQEIVIKGIFEFIFELSSNYKTSKINFSDTLNLIDEIGSPTEIIESFDFTTDFNKNNLQCPSCKWKNDPKTIFCEYCGKEIKKIYYNSSLKENLLKTEFNKDFTQKLKHDYFEHPYSRNIIYSTLIITIILLIRGYRSFLTIHSMFDLILISTIGISLCFAVSIIPSLLLGSFLGFIVNIKIKSKKSLIVRQDKILNHFEQNLAEGFILVFIGTTFLVSWLGFGIDVSFQPLMVLLWSIFIILDIFMIFYYHKPNLKPLNMNLTELGNLKLIVDKNNNKQFLRLNITSIPYILIISFIMIILNYVHFSTTNGFNMVPALTFFFLYYVICCIFIINGFLSIRLNSWREISMKYLMNPSFNQ